MTEPVIESGLGVTLLGGAPVDIPDILAAMAHAPVLVAADGGAAHALRAGLMPRAVIGDMDSLDPDSVSRLGPELLHIIPDQNTTDLEKCLARIVAPLILGVGFLGGRADHQMAALNALVRAGDRRIVLVGAQDVVAHVPDRLNLRLRPGTRVSLFPMAPVTGRSQGLVWPIDGIRFAPDGAIGTSNRVSAGRLALAFDGPGMLVILPREALAPLIAG